MIGWIAAGILGAVAAAAIVITISGLISKSRIKKEMRDRGVNDIILSAVNKCSNTIQFKDLESDNTYEIWGDGIADDLYEGQEIMIGCANAISPVCVNAVSLDEQDFWSENRIIDFDDLY